MAGLDPSDRRQQDPEAPAPARARRLPLAAAVILVGLAANLALCVRRVGDDPRAVGFTHLTLLLLFGAIRRFELSPPGSPARGRARLAVWLLTTALTAAFTWRMGALLPLGLAIAAWVVAAATVVGGFYMLFVHGDK